MRYSRPLAFLVVLFFGLAIITLLRIGSADAQGGAGPISGRFYKFDKIAQTGQEGITSIGSVVSINDSGTVAFLGRTSAVTSSFFSQVFTRKIVGPINTITAPTTPDNRRLYGSMQISNSEQIITEFERGRNPPLTGVMQEIRRWDGNAFETGAVLATGDSNVSSGSTFSIFLAPTGLSNDNHSIAYASTHGGGGTVLAKLTPALSTSPAPPSEFSSGPKPVVADGGEVLVKPNFTTTALRLYSSNLATFTDVATISSTAFSTIGNAPGISDDGQIIAFYGVLNVDPGSSPPYPNYNQTYRTTAGPGIFISFVDPTTSVRKVVRVARRQIENLGGPFAGRNEDGVCDPGEACLIGPADLGVDLATGAARYLDSFSADSRIGVIHQSLGAAGLEGDTVVVACIAAPNGANPAPAPQWFTANGGIWTIRVDLKLESGAIREKPFAPIPVIQVLDNLDSTSVTSIGILEDPIAKVPYREDGAPRTESPGDHRLTFIINNDRVYRATQIDSDGDGLFDHWETSGLDFNNDRTPDLALNLAPYNANPLRKDIFVEIDYMVGGAGRNHKPGVRPDGSPLPTDPIDTVRTAFANAPVPNPIGGPGITLHAMNWAEPNENEQISEFLTIQFGSRLPGASDDFFDIKYGSNNGGGLLCRPSGSPPAGTFDGRFGRAADRASTNCANIMGARFLTFHYVVFGNRQAGSPTVPINTASGRSELPGNDTLVSLGLPDWEAEANNYVAMSSSLHMPRTFNYYWSSFQAATFMHELGHSVGLKHGGSTSFVTCKPNVLSVMSYSRQLDQFAFATGIPGLLEGQEIPSDRRIDYSNAVLPSLTNPALLESSLDESLGVSGPAGERTLFGRPTPTGLVWRIANANGAIDWSGIVGIDTAPVAGNINFAPGGCRNATTSPSGQTLAGFNDWQNLTYNFRSGRDFADGFDAQTTELGGVPELSAEQARDGMGREDIDEDGVINSIDNCLFAPNSNQLDINSNGVGDACDSLTTSLSDLDIVVAGVGGMINNAFDYQVTATNLGPSVANGVVVSDPLPPQLSLVFASTTQGSCSSSAGNIQCDLGTMLSSASATITIRVTPTVTGKIDNRATVSAGFGSSDPNLVNNSGGTSSTITDNSQLYSISGQVNVNGLPTPGEIPVLLSGSQSALAFTDANGNYSFSNLPSGGYYFVTVQKYGIVFTPESGLVLNLSAHHVMNFAGALTNNTPSKNADFDGDGKTDISVFRPSDGYWYVWRSLTSTAYQVPWGFGTDILTPGDFDGDKKTDFAVWRASDGQWYVYRTIDGQVDYIPWGLASDIPVPGDYDGDGQADVAVWRPSTGVWYIYRSSDGLLEYYTFGGDGDIPIVGDFDGDRRVDFSIFRPSNGAWYIQQTTLGYKAVLFGYGTDELVPADYDGDGTTDYGVFRPSTGQWFTAPSSEAIPGQNFTAISFGQAGDIVAPGDYDGDGKYDRAVFRPSDGTWYILKSGDLTNYSLGWGLSGDKPIPREYMP